LEQLSPGSAALIAALHMTKLERLAYWKEVADDPSPVPWINEEDDLFAYFQRFRPHGLGVEKVFEGVERGDEILKRLLPCYEHTKESAESHMYFIVLKPQVTTSDELIEILRTYFNSVTQMAIASDAWDVVNLLGSVEIDTEKAEPPPHSNQPEPGFSMIYDTVCDWIIDLKPVASDAILLKEAFYSMACDYELAGYIMWPIYRETTPILDPLAPCFELWIRGAEFRFTSDKSVTVYSPSIRS
jgi:hypothetical protein